MKKVFTIAALAVAALVSACGGGGGGGGGDAPAPGSTTGFWGGTTSNGLEVSAVVFADGSTWALYAGGVSFGFVQGSINGSAKDFSLTSGTITDVTLSATATTKSRINGTISAPGTAAVTFNGTYDATFEQTPSLAAAAGTYTGVSPSVGTTLTLAASGAISGATGGCAFAGTATPRTDANVFNVSITFGAAPCALPGATVTGIAVYDPTDKALVAPVVNSARTFGTMFLGTKP
jgi:hypothetical protein